MANWIEHPTTLIGEAVILLPMEEAHFDELIILAKDKRIWEYYAFDGSDTNRFAQVLDAAMVEKEKGTQYPFSIFHKAENRLIGSTRLMDIQPIHRKLEVGGTWLHPDFWASEVNVECKLLLMTHCFEQLKTVRVLLKTDETNVRSRKAIEKIGGQFEGILRNDMIRDNMTFRNSAYYSIIEGEWEGVKENLVALYQSKITPK